MTRAALIALLLLLLGAVAAGCASSSDPPRNKAGAEAPSKRLLLRIESTNAGSAEALHFAERIQKRSEDALRVEILQSYPGSLPANEGRLARAVRAGEVDFGILPARAWPAAGVREFDALQAPFVLGDYEVARRAIAGPAGAALKDALERARVIPLGLVPAQLRRVLAVKPLVTPGDFRGLRIRISDNATSVADLRALGAEPIEGVSTDGVNERLSGGQLDGVETAPIWAVSNQYGRDAHHITAYALFDSVDTLVASPAAWKSLSAAHQDAIRAAAQDTARWSKTLPKRDAQNLEQLCGIGVRVTTPSVMQLDAIADATEPVRAALRRDAATRKVIHLLEATEGAGPKLLPTPDGCSTGDARGAEQTSDSATIPNGAYEVTTTRKDNQRFGEYGSAWSSVPAFEWTTRLNDGKWVRTVVPRFPGQTGDVDGAGTYRVNGDKVVFRYTYPEPDASPPETLRWSYYDGRLTLEVVGVADRGARIIYSAHPWRKVR